jgi:hypothetical protein
MSYWGSILSAAQNSLDTSSFFSSIKADMESRGEVFGPTGAAAFSSARGAATAMVRAQNVLAAAPSNYAITADMIGVVPYGQTAMGKAGSPRYNVRATYQTVQGGETTYRSFVTQDVDLASVTAGDLRAQAYQDAADAAAGYEGGLRGDVSISIEQM